MYRADMDRAKAVRMSARMQAEHADRGEYRFFVRRDSSDSWSVARLRVPESLRTSPSPTSAEHPPPAPLAEDTRSGHEMRVPGLPGGLG
jgi:hypothetical protein